MSEMVKGMGISKKNYFACLSGERSFLVCDNSEISMQKGEKLKHWEQEVDEPVTGRWFMAEVKFVTNYNQTGNNVVYEFEITERHD